MVGPEGKPLLLEEARALLDRLEQAVVREACWSCESLQGFIAQLELDASEDVKSLLQTYEVRPQTLHRCLGCVPCEPAEVFARYAKGA